jgi:hypothetical protein
MMNQPISETSLNAAEGSVFKRFVRFIWEQIGKAIVISVFGGVIAGIIVGNALRRQDQRQAEENQATRVKLQGYWLFQTKTDEATYNPYKGMTIVEQVSLTVDQNFSVQGVAYKWLETTKNDAPHAYQRTERMKSNVTGSIAGNHLVLNWDSIDSSGRPSIQTFDGLTSGAIAQPFASGRFFSDVGAQIGTFCATKITDFKVLQAELPHSYICTN